MTEENIVAFLEEISRVLQPSGHLFLWVDKFHLCQGDIPWWGQNTDLNLVDMLVWDKGRIGMGYRSRHKSEYCIVLQKALSGQRVAGTTIPFPMYGRKR